LQPYSPNGAAASGRARSNKCNSTTDEGSHSAAADRELALDKNLSVALPVVVAVVMSWWPPDRDVSITEVELVATAPVVAEVVVAEVGAAVVVAGSVLEVAADVVVAGSVLGPAVVDGGGVVVIVTPPSTHCEEPVHFP